MKKLSLLFIGIISMFATGCNNYMDGTIADPVNPQKQLKVEGSRYEPQYYVDVKPAEVCYMIKMTGNSEKNQAKTSSGSFKDKQKVQGKRVRIPFTKVLASETLLFSNWKWLPEYMIIKLDCSMKTMEWTQSPKDGSTPNDDAIRMESKESIEFYQNFVLSARINQDKDYVYLDQFGVKPLEEVLNKNVKGDIASYLAAKASRNDLKDLRGMKDSLYSELESHIKSKYSKFGVDIIMVGAKGGFNYKDKAIQEAINNEFKASLLESVALKEQKQKMAEIETKKMEADIFRKSEASIVAQQELKMRMDLNDAKCAMLRNSKIDFAPSTYVTGEGGSIDAYIAKSMEKMK